MRLVAYLRVSSAVQVEAWGLDRQESAIRSWVKANGHRIAVWERDEGQSGTREAVDRPGLSAAIEAVTKGDADGIVVADLDRFARKLTVQETALALVWRAGGEVFTATAGVVPCEDPDDPSRNLIRQVMGAVIEYEKNMSVLRMRQGKRAKAATGRKTDGQYAFGMQRVGAGREKDAGPQAEQRAVVRRIVEAREAGDSFRAICDALNADQVPTKHGRAWLPMTVKRIHDRALQPAL